MKPHCDPSRIFTAKKSFLSGEHLSIWLMFRRITPEEGTMYIGEKNDKIETPLIMKAGFLVAGFLAAFLLLRIFITPWIVPDNSMNPNFKKGAFVLVLKHFPSAKKGRAVLVRNPSGSDTVTLKRVAAVEGEKVEIIDKTILINGVKTSLPWKTVSTDIRLLPAPFSHRDTMEQTPVGKDQVFLLGDNLDFSFDSREFGPVKKDDIIGFVFMTF